MKRMLSAALSLVFLTCAIPMLAQAYELNGTVVSAVTQNVTTLYGGAIDQVPVRVGQTVRAGDTIATLQTTKVYAKESGKVYLFGSVGDYAESVAETYGAVAYLEPELTYSLTGSTKYAYDSEATKLTHPGERVFLRTVTGDYTGHGLITTVADSSFEVLITDEGDLSSGESVNIFRGSNAHADQRLGRGTVVRRGPAAYTGAGVIVSYAVTSGQKVNKGDLLFETLSGTYQGQSADITLIKAPVDGVIAALSVSPGSAVSEGGDIASIYPLDSVRVEATALVSDLPGIRLGDIVRVELIYSSNGDQILNGQVEYISSLGAASTSEESEESTFTVYITLSDPDLNAIAYGMNAIVTSTGQTAPVSVSAPEPTGEEAETPEG